LHLIDGSTLAQEAGDHEFAVSSKTGLFFGKIQIEDGATNRTIENVLKVTVISFTNLLRDAIEVRKLPRASPALSSPGDVVSQLERLAQLIAANLPLRSATQKVKLCVAGNTDTIDPNAADEVL